MASSSMHILILKQQHGVQRTTLTFPNMAPSKKTPNASGDNNNAVPDEEVRKESSKAANQAISAQRKAQELKQAAAGAGDPEERQKLMEQAIDAQIQAESFGKTAKYMRSGTFQGLAVGTGLGVAPGATLGALAGTLVGGVTSTITGGLGGGIGAAAGAMHGPIWNMGEVAGKGIQVRTCLYDLYLRYLLTKCFRICRK
jgi:hypothetical protein